MGTEPTWTGKQVESDFKFHKGTPIWHMLDRAVHFHNGKDTADRSWDAIRDVLMVWMSYLGKMDELEADTEGQ